MRAGCSIWRARPITTAAGAIRQRVREIAAARVRYGYRKIRVLLQREGFELSKKVVYRLYREEGLSLRYRASRRRRAQATRAARAPVNTLNVVWSLDFVCDQLSQGQRFRALTVVDVFTREALAIEVGQQLRAADVVNVLDRLRRMRGCPQSLSCDNVLNAIRQRTSGNRHLRRVARRVPTSLVNYAQRFPHGLPLISGSLA